MYVKVAFPLPIRKLFFYKVPDRLKDTVKIGSMVLAPFRSRILTGYIVELCPPPEIDLIKELVDICFDEEMFSPELLKLCRWISEYYFAPLGEVIEMVLPKGINRFSYLRVKLLKEEKQKAIKGVHQFSRIEQELITLLRKRRSLSLKSLQERFKSKYFFSSLRNLERIGQVEIDYTISSPKVSPLYEDFLRVRDSELSDAGFIFGKRKAPVQKNILQYLIDSEKKEVSKNEILNKFKNSSGSIKGLIDKKLLEINKKQVERQYKSTYRDDFQKPSQLTVHQNEALKNIFKAIDKEQSEIFLIYGVTGSGKTQVYIEAIDKVLKLGKSAIYLVPEIALTPQTEFRLKKYFKDDVELIHSRMGKGERFDAWRRIKNGKRKLVVGPRSAIFAPLHNIALIIVDEEHEESYDQQDIPRYNARNTALMRGKFNNAVVILGSATPSLESFHNAKSGKYDLIRLPERIDEVPLPKIKIIDMKEEWKGRKGIFLAEYLVKRMTEQLEQGEQILLLQNRRGFSTYMYCKDCGHIEECKNCTITLTFHRKTNKLHCHYCGFKKHVPVQCQECKGTHIVFSGTGTQKVEEEIKKLFPELETKRLDLDSAHLKGAHEKITGDFVQGEYQILVGTKMISKGFDFSNVNFAGVINADISLQIPDFRASEKSFQLLTQFAGRTGRRDVRGEVVIQTYNPGNYCLHAVKKHDFEEFYEIELEGRKELDFPPFGRLVLLRFHGENEFKVMEISQKIGKFISRKFGNDTIMGPVPAPIPKINKLFRWNALVKIAKERDKTGRRIREITRNTRDLYESKYKKSKVRMSIYVDPQNLM